MSDPAEMMARLAADIAGELQIPDARPLSPHLTLARATGVAVDLGPWIAEADAPRGALLLEQIHLMRSHTDRGGARYETLSTFALGGFADV